MRLIGKNTHRTLEEGGGGGVLELAVGGHHMEEKIANERALYLAQLILFTYILVFRWGGRGQRTSKVIT